jgi:hypothetical protein
MKNDTLIVSAIQSKRLIQFEYSGLTRTCEPHVFGVANSRRQVLCWQEDGLSSRGGLPEWRRFDLSEMTNLTVLRSQKFPGKRPVPKPHSLGWDQFIAIVS